MRRQLEFRYREMGDHVHVRVFSRVPSRLPMFNGQLVFTRDEWADAQEHLQGSSVGVSKDNEPPASEET